MLKQYFFKIPFGYEILRKISGSFKNKALIADMERKLVYRYIADFGDGSHRKIIAPCFEFERNLPSLSQPVSQACTEAQFDEPDFHRLCKVLRREPIRHRKLWEYIFILRALELHGALRPSNKGLGFGVGKDPMIALMAQRGCSVVATDMDIETAHQKGWLGTNQFSRKLEDFNERGVCSSSKLKRAVTLRTVDMNTIPLDLKNNSFDFVWSACAFEHLGSLENGIHFVLESLKCLRPGGIAIHTTEFNVSSNEETVMAGDTVIYRKKDIESLVEKARQQGYLVEVNFNVGTDPMDKFYDIPPYSEWNHIKLQLDKYVTTSFGLIFKKPL